MTMKKPLNKFVGRFGIPKFPQLIHTLSLAFNDKDCAELWFSI
jgi:hypothetical protein